MSAGIENTNALALEFTKIAAKNGRVIAAPAKTYITGVSMGGHIAAAAIEDEAALTANNKVKYAGAVPMCAVAGTTELFDTVAAIQVAAQAVAGLPSYPINKWLEIEPLVRSTLFTAFPSTPTPVKGAQFASILQNLTGGPPPDVCPGAGVWREFSIGVRHIWQRWSGDRYIE